MARTAFLTLMIVVCLTGGWTGVAGASGTGDGSPRLWQAADGSLVPGLKMELTEKRTEFSKTFVSDDKSLTTFLRAGAMHYLDPGSGEWRDIDTRVVPLGPVAADLAGYRFANQTGECRHYFAGRANGPGVQMRCERPEYRGQHRLSLAGDIEIGFSDLSGERLPYMSSESVPAEVVGNQVIYRDIVPGVDQAVTVETDTTVIQYQFRQRPAFVDLYGEYDFLYFRETYRLPAGYEVVVDGQPVDGPFSTDGFIELRSGDGSWRGQISTPAAASRNDATLEKLIGRRQGRETKVPLEQVREVAVVGMLSGTFQNGVLTLFKELPLDWLQSRPASFFPMAAPIGIVERLKPGNFSYATGYAYYSHSFWGLFGDTYQKHSGTLEIQSYRVLGFGGSALYQDMCRSFWTFPTGAFTGTTVFKEISLYQIFNSCEDWLLGIDGPLSAVTNDPTTAGAETMYNDAGDGSQYAFSDFTNCSNSHQHYPFYNSDAGIDSAADEDMRTAAGAGRTFRVGAAMDPDWFTLVNRHRIRGPGYGAGEDDKPYLRVRFMDGNTAPAVTTTLTAAACVNGGTNPGDSREVIVSVQATDLNGLKLAGEDESGYDMTLVSVVIDSNTDSLPGGAGNPRLYAQYSVPDNQFRIYKADTGTWVTLAGADAVGYFGSLALSGTSATQIETAPGNPQGYQNGQVNVTFRFLVNQARDWQEDVRAFAFASDGQTTSPYVSSALTGRIDTRGPTVYLDGMDTSLGAGYHHHDVISIAPGVDAYHYYFNNTSAKNMWGRGTTVLSPIASMYANANYSVDWDTITGLVGADLTSWAYLRTFPAGCTDIRFRNGDQCNNTSVASVYTRVLIDEEAPEPVTGLTTGDKCTLQLGIPPYYRCTFDWDITQDQPAGAGPCDPTANDFAFASGVNNYEWQFSCLAQFNDDGNNANVAYPCGSSDTLGPLDFLQISLREGVDFDCTACTGMPIGWPYYFRVRSTDNVGNVSPWRTRDGASNSLPVGQSITPSTAILGKDTWHRFTTVYRDADGCDDIKFAYFTLLRSTVDPRGGGAGGSPQFTGFIDMSTRTFNICSSLASGCTQVGAGEIRNNGMARFDRSLSSLDCTGTNLTVNWAIQFIAQDDPSPPIPGWQGWNNDFKGWLLVEDQATPAGVATWVERAPSIKIDTTPPQIIDDGYADHGGQWYRYDILYYLVAEDPKVNNWNTGIRKACYSWDQPVDPAIPARCLPLAPAADGTWSYNGSLTEEGKSTLYLYAQDQALNTYQWNGPYRLDKTPPIVLAEGANICTDLSCGWIRPSGSETSLSVRLIASDGLSGVTGGLGYMKWDDPTMAGALPFPAMPVNPLPTTSLLEGVHTLYLRASDRAGNTISPPWAGTYKYDSTQPGMKIARVVGGGGYSTQFPGETIDTDQTVAFQVWDYTGVGGAGGSGLEVATYHYCGLFDPACQLASESTATGAVQACTGEDGCGPGETRVTLSFDSYYRISSWARDFAGNTTSGSEVIAIKKIPSPPVVTVECIDVAPADGWCDWNYGAGFDNRWVKIKWRLDNTMSSGFAGFSYNLVKKDLPDLPDSTTDPACPTSQNPALVCDADQLISYECIDTNGNALFDACDTYNRPSPRPEFSYIILKNLDFPEYDFKIKVKGNNGQWSTPAVVRIQINRPKDTTRNMLVRIPGAEFEMGSRDADARPDERPHRVFVDPYYIQQHEVSRASYAVCVEQGGCSPIPGVVEKGMTLADEELPVTGVAWDQAREYCEWKDLRLPTEAEWELAAKGVQGYRYPWGDELASGEANFGGGVAAALEASGLRTAGESPFNLIDMAGNAAEWVADLHGPYQPAIRGAAVNPVGPVSVAACIDLCDRDDEACAVACATRVVRGGSYLSSDFEIRTTSRDGLDPASTAGDVGFRCARSALSRQPATFETVRQPAALAPVDRPDDARLRPADRPDGAQVEVPVERLIE